LKRIEKEGKGSLLIAGLGSAAIEYSAKTNFSGWLVSIGEFLLVFWVWQSEVIPMIGNL
jgi:hypothetical protein